MVLAAVARLEGASSRQVADLAQVSDQAQISRLLARLEGLGLVQNSGGQSAGYAKSWRLTPRGEEFLRATGAVGGDDTIALPAGGGGTAALEYVVPARRSPGAVPARRSAKTARAGRRGASRGARRERAVSPSVVVSGHQRARLLAGAVWAVDRLGFTQTTVGHITERAHVSRRTFYELFADREDCLLAVLKDTAGRLTAELQAAELNGLSWRERVRTGLWTILCFFEADPALARVCVVESARGGRGVLEYRAGVLAALTAVIDRGRGESSRAAQCPRLTAEGLAGATLAILYARLHNGAGEPLGDLLGELSAMIVLPYLGPAAAKQERARPVPAAPSRAVRVRSGGGPAPDPQRVTDDPLRAIPMRVTQRTALVLTGIAEQSERGANPNNREVAELAGVSDEGQISKLLARLERLGLLQNAGAGHARGASNAWSLTPLGDQVTQQIAPSTSNAERTI
jgi:AcrR family transcriptional regulator/DNA-binding MarR family transcriptional regulator